MFQQARVNILRVKKKNVERSGYTNAEIALCTIWICQGYGAIDIPILFQKAY